MTTENSALTNTAQVTGEAVSQNVPSDPELVNKNEQPFPTQKVLETVKMTNEPVKTLPTPENIQNAVHLINEPIQYFTASQNVQNTVETIKKPFQTSISGGDKSELTDVNLDEHDNSDLSDVSFEDYTTTGNDKPVPSINQLKFIQSLVDLSSISPQISDKHLPINVDRTLTNLINILVQIKKRLDTFKKDIQQLTAPISDLTKPLDPDVQIVSVEKPTDGGSTDPTDSSEHTHHSNDESPNSQIIYTIEPSAFVSEGPNTQNADFRDARLLFKRRHPILWLLLKG